jgi:ketosteroid isomerase-like protein
MDAVGRIGRAGGRTGFAWAVVMLGFASGAGAQGAVPFDGPEADDVRAREVGFAKSMADRDFDAFRTFLHPDAVFFSGSEAIRGAEAVAAAWQPFFEGEVAPFSWAPDLVQVLESGDLALTSGPVRAASGETVGRFNSIWRRDRSGQWYVVFDKGS